MKKLFTLVAIAFFFSCNGPKDPPDDGRKKMNGIEFLIKYGIQHPALDYTSGELSRGKKAKAGATTFTVFENALVLSESGGVLTTSISPNAEWGGVQKFIDISTNDGAASVCNWNWSWSAAPASMTCNSSGTGNYRSWTSDKVTYDVHLSLYLPL